MHYDHIRHALAFDSCVLYQYCQCAGDFILPGISVSNIWTGCAEPDCTEEAAVVSEYDGGSCCVVEITWTTIQYKLLIRNTY